MQKDKKILTEAQMEKITGGITPPVKKDEPIQLRDEPHCKACGAVVSFIRGAYRCINVDCDWLNIPKTIDEVNWL